MVGDGMRGGMGGGRPGLFNGDLGPGPGFGGVGMGGDGGMLLGPNHGAWGGGMGMGGGMPQPRFDPYGPGVPGQGQGPPGFFPPPGHGQGQGPGHMDPSNMGQPNNDHLEPPGPTGSNGPKMPKDDGPPPGMYF